ncbi:MAG: alanine--tRNA ligase [Thaumarchaeota archaeon]|nr:alanine--tRNA ligase [Nitrososphaerota archaeon]
MTEKDELVARFSSEPDKYYKVELFDRLGFERKKCSNCWRYFWALVNRERCPNCESYGFIGKPPTNKRLDYVNTWKEIEKFFTKNNHTSIKRYPVVCRWREDLFFTVASIVDFQRVIGGKVVFELPTNPLIVPQMCLRFNDIENVGVSGKHYTSFCMIGQHSFANEQGYWKDRCIELDYGMLTEGLGINKEEITFVEDVWLGYGAFGYSLEYFVRGLELGNAVFTEFEGTPKNHRVMKEKIIDMGAGLERFSWITMGTPTSYDCCFGPIIKELGEKIGLNFDNEILSKYFTIMSNKLEEIGSTKELKTIAAKELKLDYEKLEKMVMPIEAVYTIADHTRTLLFAISDGALPSNVGGGYNLRVILRRALATLHRLGWNIKLEDVADMLINYLKTIYPELEEHRDEIKTILGIETNRYHESTERMKRIANNLVKGKKQPSNEELIKLYESDGITPDFLKEQCVISNIPPNFYAELAVLHNEQALQKALKPITGIDSVEPTKLLFYEDQNITDFEAKIVKIIGKYIVLDKTAFYARGGGQEPDHGMIANTAVNDVVKQGNVVLHEIMNETLKEGSIVKCAIDPIRRGLIMRHHTATHVLNSAARNALGSWVWQHSAFKDYDSARLDITHHSSLTRDDIMKIEKFANKAIQENLPVVIKTLDRNQAEQLYGFRIYQGGYVPNSEIRIVNIEGWDIEACAGTHVTRTGEIGMLKIIKAERIQDGVVRLEFVAGQAALEYIQKQEEQLNEIVRTLGSSKEKLIESFQNTMKDTDETRKKLKTTVKKFAPLIVNDVIQKTKHIGKIKLFTVYEKELDEEYHIVIGEQAIDIEPSLIYCSLIAKEQGIRVIVFVGEGARNNGIKAGVIAKQIANTIDGSGGGDDRFGQGGGKSVERIKNVLLKIEEFVRK